MPDTEARYERASVVHDPLLTAEDVADLLGMSLDWVREETRRNRLPHLKLGRCRRYRRESIDQWIRSSECGKIGGDK